MYNIRCDPMHPLNDMCGYVPVCAVYASAGYTWGSGRTSVYLCATSLQNHADRKTFVPLSVSLCNDLADPVFDGVGLQGFKSCTNAFLFA